MTGVCAAKELRAESRETERNYYLFTFSLHINIIHDIPTPAPKLSKIRIKQVVSKYALLWNGSEMPNGHWRLL